MTDKKELIGHGFSLRNRVETLKAEVNTLCNVTEQLQTRVEELERENFALSAFQCHSGKSDAGGNMHCDFQDEIVQLQVRCTELERELQEEKSVHQVTYNLMLSGEKRGVEKGREESQHQIDALAAHVELLTSAALGVTSKNGDLNLLLALATKAPQQSLAKHDAEVARKAITKAKETFVLGSNGNEDFQAGIDYCVDAYDKHLDRYAQRIKDGEI
jgi:predicted RNase H-like nuclease (RuvC/YqgF family)